jgi:hypothetical protein
MAMTMGRERVRHTDRKKCGGRGGREGRMERNLLAIEDQKRRQPHHTTQHHTIRRTGTTIEMGTGRDEMRHDREWRCMEMTMGGEREREERVRHTDTQTDTHTDRGVAGEEGGTEGDLHPIA